jgi:hypothetical protein
MVPGGGRIVLVRVFGMAKEVIEAHSEVRL